MSDARHHTAHREIIFIEVPVAGSPKEGRRLRPGPYKRNSFEPWRPATRPPNKAERLKRFLDDMRRNDEIARECMRPDVVGLRSWLAEARF